MSRLAAFCLGLALWLFVGHVQAQTCSQPSNLSGAPLTPTSIRLSWSGIQGALNYTVQYRLSNSITWTTAPATALTQLTLSGLLPESVYTWRVRANCSTYSIQYRRGRRQHRLLAAFEPQYNAAHTQ